MMQVEDWLIGFVYESNKIEGIDGVSEDDLSAHLLLLECNRIRTTNLEHFVKMIAPAHRLRDKEGLNVRVGDYVAPSGGEVVRSLLDGLLFELEGAYTLETPHSMHVAYEQLHPFTDGNGRSGRALWLWQMLRTDEAERAKKLGFLHTFYYQTLASASVGV